MKLITVILFSLALSIVCRGHTMGKVEMDCPLDGTKFEAYQDFSGTSFGAGLDMKPVGPTPAPWALAVCPSCGFPIYEREFDEDAKARLRGIVSGKRFSSEAREVIPYFALGILFDELKEEPLRIAQTYLQATWQVDSNETHYAVVAERTIEWCDKAADALKDSKEGRDDFLFASYLAIELCRRRGDFEGARKRLESFPSVQGTQIEWLESTLADQRRLVEKQDAAPHVIGEFARES